MIIKYENDKIIQVLSSRELERNPKLKSQLTNFIEIPEQHIDLMKDTVVDGKLVKWSPAPKRLVSEKEFFDKTHPKNISPYIEPHKKVGIICRLGDNCGIANYTEDLARNSVVDYVILCQRDFKVSTFETLNVVPIWMPEDPNYDKMLHKILQMNIDIVNIQYNHGIFNAGAMKEFGNGLKRNKIRSLMTFHSTKGGVTVFKDHYDEFIIHSNAMKRDLMEAGVIAERIHLTTIGNNAKNQLVYTKEEACALCNIENPNRPIVATFGFLLPHKGVIELLKAISILKDDWNKDILLLIVCNTDNFQHRTDSKDLKLKIDDLIKELHLEKNTLFITDFLKFETINEYLCCADVITLAYLDSAAQGASAASRTALMIQKPLIISELEVFSDLLDLLPTVTPGYVEELAETIKKYIENKALRNQLIENIKKFNQNTDWVKVSEQQATFYKALGDYKIDIEGQVYSYFSASEISRYMTCALLDIGTDVQLTSINMAENKGLLFERREDFESCMYGIKRKNAVLIRNFYPPNFDKDERILISYIPAETTKISDDWVKKINENVDYVWTYSAHSVNSIVNSGVTKPVKAIGPGFDEELYNKKIIPLDLSRIPDSYTKKTVPIADDTFVFMFIGAAQKRKGIDILLKAWYNYFNKSDNAVLVIKSYTSGEIHKEILSAQYECGKPDNMYPRLLYVFEDSDAKKLARYYGSCATEFEYDTDFGKVKAPCGCGVLPSRAEGWGWIGMLFGAVGAPMIATNFGGHLDFLNKDNSFLIDGKMVKSDYHEQGGDSSWCEVDPKDLADLMRHVMDNHKERKEKADKLHHDMHLDWTWKSTAYKIIKWMKENCIYNLK